MLITCTLALAVCTTAPAQDLPFTLTEVGPNVWAAIGGSNPATSSNAGFVIGAEGVVVIDTFTSAAGAKQLLAEIRRRTRLPIRFVVNTHHHLDHVAGNAVFIEAGAVVIAHRNVHGWIRPENLRLLGLASSAVQPELKAMVEGIAPPAMGYDDELDLHLGSRLARVRWMAGHTGGDSVVTIPDARVVFTGDLFWNRGLPNLIDATTDSWIKTLDAVTASSPDSTFVPGHGGLGRATDVTAFREYLATLRRLVSMARERRLASDALVATVRSTLAGPYGQWDFFEYLAAPNILQMEEELNGTKRVPR
jgi:glyoxylase-like metal-dependent hydrolase (beta-lactamase superfamily II)